jgi:hypothetical protein
VDPCLARPDSIARPPAATQVAVFLRRRQGKIEGKTGCPECDELSDPQGSPKSGHIGSAENRP